MDPYSPKRTNSSSTASSVSSHEQDQVRYKKVHVPLAYPSEAIKEHTYLTKSYVYPPLMSPSDDFFSPPPTQPMTIATTKANSSGGETKKSPTSPLRTGSLPSMAQPLPSPPVSPWKRSVSFTTRPTRSATMVLDETPFPDLPTDVRAWTSSQVAEYLGYSLRRYPRAITEDLGRYVRQTACLDGAQFIDLREEDLERMQINLKWRTMILKAVGMLRRETIRASRVDTMHWEDGHDADKDEPLANSISSSEGSSSDSSTFLGGEQQLHPTHHQHHSSSASAESQSSFHRQDSRLGRTMEPAKETPLDPQELRKGIVEDITEILQSWKKEQEAKTKKLEQAAATGGLGFMEGVIIGGLLVAFMLRFSR
ncbi:hypothetical protein EMPS_00540 [Entomortierella parvispora]|uniref:SAM domain-containing protein n=1 Tax=Entomortierella parvispora TaxID=205924 RepID=A0A9P3H190_9FUNG|nr:hypothetical protein EMPS_00540 [Entomortierella parvispora]